MDSYYSSSSSSTPSTSYYYNHHYHQTSCPLHDSPSSPSFLSDSYPDPCLSYQQPSSSSSSYFYPTYHDSTTSPFIFYNNSTTSTTNIYSPSTYPTPPSNHPLPTPTQSTPTLNTTFELAPPTGRRRRQRTIFSKDQVDILDQVFEKNQYPDIQLREQLSERLDVPEARIQVWFKNRRSRARTTNKSKF